MLVDPDWAGWSDRNIAKHVGVGYPLVAALRNPEVAQKQQDNRDASATKKAQKAESDSTSTAPDRKTISPVGVESDSTSQADEPDIHPSERGAYDLQEAHDTIVALDDENEALWPMGSS